MARKKKINLTKTFNKLGKDIDKGFKENISRDANKEFFNPLGNEIKKAAPEIEKFAKDKVLPGVVSVGIPLASQALGMLGTELGLPPEITSSLSENLMKELIPKQYQSDNKYVNLLGTALKSGLSGNPNSFNDVSQQFMGNVQSDLSNYFGNDKISQQVPIDKYFNPDNPYDDLMTQLLSKYTPLPQEIQHPQPSIQNTIQQTQQTHEPDYNAMNDALYKDSELGKGADSLVIKSPPYQQREGSTQGLLGGGLRKKKVKKIKEISSSEDEVYVKTKPTYKKFTHSKNASLHQLLEANRDKEYKEAKKALRELINKQTQKLTAEGYGLSKGSNAMKIKMAKLRSLRKKK